MQLLFGPFIHKSQLAMELDKSRSEDKKNANAVLKMKSVITIEHFIAPIETKYAAVIIRDGNTPVKQFIGKWTFDHTENEEYFYSNYFRFKPICEVKSFTLETVDRITDHINLYYTFNDYKKL